MSERGSITFWVLGLSIAVLFLGGISVDLWRVMSDRRELAAVADSAAAAGASAIDVDHWRDTGEIRLLNDGAIDLAQRVVAQHGVAGDADGNVYVAEIYAHRITELNAGETPKRVAGTGSAGSGPDQLNKPAGVLVHDGYLWIADLDNHRISVVPLDSLAAEAKAVE